MQSIIAIWKQAREVTKKGSTERKLWNQIRIIYEEDYCYLDKYSLFKRDRRQEEKDENLVITSNHIIFKRKILHSVQRLWRELDAKDREFIVSYNRKVKHNKSTDEIDVPSNFRALFKDKSSTSRSPNIIENQSSPRSKIIFNLQQDDEEE